MVLVSSFRCRLRRSASVFAVLVLSLPFAVPVRGATPERPTSFNLANGMQVVVIPDHRAPVVTHMLWYRVGAADDPPGKSGLAHFLEHLMFKATARIKTGEFTRIVNRLGARHNALTAHDTTAYFQRSAKEHLSSLMELEADRMVNLRFDAQEVLTEREVIKEERRSSIDASPIAALNEQLLAALYQNHPYRRPVLGWAHEIKVLDRADAAAFYERHYAVNNAVLVVAGDVTEAEVRALAEKTYGKNRSSPTVAATERQRAQEPDHIATRKVILEDMRASEPLLLRAYHVPSLRTAPPNEGAALTVLARILGGDDTSRLYQQLVLKKKIAVQSGADFQGGNRDSGRLALLALAAKDRTVAELETAFDEVVSEIVANGVTPDELARSKRSLEADHVFTLDNQEKRARHYGAAITIGRTLADIESEHLRIQEVTAADVQMAANAHLQLRRSVSAALVKPKSATR